MVNRLIEGFETARHTTYLDRKYRSQDGNSGFIAGYHAGYAGQWDADGHLYTKTLSASNENEWFVGFRFKALSNTGAGTPGDTEFVGVKFFANTDTSPECQAVLILERVTNNAYEWQLRRGEDRTGTLIATSSSFWANKWYYFEIYVELTNTGSYEIKIDGVSDVSGSADMAALTSDEGADSVGFELDAQFLDVPYIYIDDIYINDGSGGVDDDYWGDGMVRGALPDSDGTYEDWDPSSGTDSYAMVDDSAISPNDSDYLSEETIGNKTSLGFAAFTLIVDNIAAIQLNSFSAMQSSGSRTYKHFIRSGSTDQDGSVAFALASVIWDGHSESINQDPNTAAAWTLSGLNAAEFGVKITA